MQRYREGGWGWVIVLAAFFSKFFVYGSLKAFGVLLTVMTEDFRKDLWIIGSIGTLNFGVQYILAPVAAALARFLGSRKVIAVSGLFGLGFVLASISEDIFLFAAAILVFVGTGAALVIGPLHAEISFYFYEKYALANVIALAGISTGIALYGPVTQVLLDTYGWRGAMLLLGGFGFNLTVCGLVVRRPNSPYIETTDGKDVLTDASCSVSQPTDESKPTNAATKPRLICNSLLSATGLDVFGSSGFLLLTLSRMLYSSGLGGIVIYMVPNGLAVGLSADEASFLTMALGIGNLIGLGLSAVFLYMKLLPYYSIAAIGGIMAALCLAVDPLVPTFIGQALINFTVGVGTNFLIMVISVRTRCLPFSDDRFVTVLGWQHFMTGVASAVGGVIVGWLYDATNSFQWTYVMFSATMMASALCLIVGFLALNKKRSEYISLSN